MGAIVLSTKSQNLFVLLACAALFILAFVFYGSQPLLSDVSYFVEADRRILRGAVPYVDIFENNPPLAFWISLPPVWFAKFTGLRAEPAFTFYTLGIVAGVLAFIWRQHFEDSRGNYYRQKLVLILAVVTTFCLAFGFGQREYFAALLLLPYISSIAQRSLGQSPKVNFALPIGFLLGIGVCFKAYFLLFPICLEIFLLIKTGNWKVAFRTETFIAAAIVVIYPILIWWLYPSYFTMIIPLTILTYGAFQTSVFAILLSSTFIIFILPFIATIVLLCFRSIKDRSVLVWLIAALVGLLIHLLQQRGWPYQLLPGLAFVTIAFLLAVLQLRHPMGQILGVLAVLMCIQPGLADYQRTQELPVARFDDLLKDQLPKRMILLTYDIGLSFPFLPARNIEWVGHYQSLWPMVAAKKKLISEVEAKKVIGDMAQILSRDLIEQSPDYVIVDHRPFSDTLHDDDENPLDSLLAYGEFAGAWSRYKMAKEDGAFQLWQRQ